MWETKQRCEWKYEKNDEKTATVEFSGLHTWQQRAGEGLVLAPVHIVHPNNGLVDSRSHFSVSGRRRAAAAADQGAHIHTLLQEWSQQSCV